MGNMGLISVRHHCNATMRVCMHPCAGSFEMGSGSAHAPLSQGWQGLLGSKRGG
jgi:hypothetical protein